MSSESLIALRDRLAEVQLLIAGDPLRPTAGGQDRDRISSPDPASHGEAVALSNALNRAAVVLACAHLEGFLEDLVVEAIDLIVSAAPPVERLPLILRALHAETYLAPLEQTRDRNARATKIQAMFESEWTLWQPGNTVSSGMLRAHAVTGEMSNPGSKEVRQFLNLIGVDVVSYFVKVGTPGLLKQIDSLVMKRNGVAHGERSAIATHEDIDRYLATLRELAAAVDAAVAEAVQQVCESTDLPWAV